MTNSALEGLPSDIIVEILSSFSNFSEMYALISTSAVCYRHFCGYTTSIITQIAFNIIGKDCWKEATTILIYHRKENNLPGYLPDYAASEFIMRKGDIRNLLTNQKTVEYFHFQLQEPSDSPSESESEDEEEAEDNAEDNAEDEPMDDAVETEDEDETQNNDGNGNHIPGFGGENLNNVIMPPARPSLFPIKFFYEMWLLSIQFGTDTIATFARRKPLTKEQLQDLHTVSEVITLDRHFYHAIRPPLWQHLIGVEPCTDLFNLSAAEEWRWIWKMWGKGYTNVGLFWKMEHHLDASFILGAHNELGEHTSLEAAHHAKMKAFELDFVKLSVEAIVEKYHLTCGWDNESLSVE